ncbi:phosphatase PAP2 family protein [Kordia zhangzhouensis]|uniref:phosphatase PAP2 family protein n=1 Tax=Kordia zhangzhouensis TaxID=1620405 RepID=UPI000629693A|nr:phosphatase PAP2 family protein [Kordia zhangzhouensis]
MRKIEFTLLVTTFLLFSSSLFSQEESPREIKYEKTIQDTGDVIQIALPATAFISTLIMDDGKGSWQFIKSFGTNLGVTYLLKYAINKPRPDGATDGHAFPSGHTSTAFQSAAFIQKRYGWKYGIPAFALAGFVAYSRIEGLNDRHDGWDVLGGIVVGIGSSYLFTTPYKRDHFKLTFSKENNIYQLGLLYRF